MGRTGIKVDPLCLKWNDLDFVLSPSNAYEERRLERHQILSSARMINPISLDPAALGRKSFCISEVGGKPSVYLRFARKRGRPVFGLPTQPPYPSTIRPFLLDGSFDHPPLHQSSCSSAEEVEDFFNARATAVLEYAIPMGRGGAGAQAAR